jgi:hypothetical protein
MTVIRENLYFTTLVMASMSLLIFAIIIQNASATTSEIRMLADLNPPTNVGGIFDGRADYRERDGAMRLNVEIEDVTPNTTFAIEVSGNTLGTITTNSFGTAELELNTNDGQAVPKVLRGDLVQILQGTQLVLRGNFNGAAADDDNHNQAPIAPAQNSSTQAGNTTTAELATVPPSNNTLQDNAPMNTTTTTTATNNVSNAVLGSLFLTGQDRLTSFNRVNETYTEVSYAGNRTIVPPNANTTATINATETGNLTLNIQPNGITFVEGQSLLVTEGGGNDSAGAEQQENATALLGDLNGVRPDDPRSSTGVAFFNTNSTGQLAFLDNMIAIYQVKASPAGTAIQMWEWKGADIPFESGSAAASTEGNQTTTNTSALVEEEQ